MDSILRVAFMLALATSLAATAQEVSGFVDAVNAETIQEFEAESNLVQETKPHIQTKINPVKILDAIVKPDNLCGAISLAWEKHARGAKLCSQACKYLQQ